MCHIIYIYIHDIIYTICIFIDYADLNVFFILS